MSKAKKPASNHSINELLEQKVNEVIVNNVKAVESACTQLVSMLPQRTDLMTLDLVGQRARELRIIELLEELCALARK